MSYVKIGIVTVTP